MVSPSKRTGARLQREHRARLRSSKCRPIFRHFASANVNASADYNRGWRTPDAMFVDRSVDRSLVGLICRSSSGQEQVVLVVLDRILPAGGSDVCCIWTRIFRAFRCRRGPSGPARDLARGLRRGAKRDRAPRRAAFGRGPGGAIDAGCEPGQMAPGAYHLVLRALPAGSTRPGVPDVRSAVRLFVQLLLCRRGSETRPAQAGPHHAAERGGSKRVSRPCGCGGARPDR